MNRTKVFFALLILTASIAALSTDTALSGTQSKQHSNSQPLGSVHGRVFAVTKGGDIKPARLAQVCLIFESRIVGHKVDPSAANEETAGLVFLDKLIEQKKQLLNELEEKSKDDSLSSKAYDNFSCKGGLLAVDNLPRKHEQFSSG
jgi:hypothetical protein